MSREQYVPELVITEPGSVVTDLRAYSTLALAIAGIGTTPTTLLISRDETVAAGVTTIPATVCVKFTNGSILTVPAGVTLNINGTLDVGIKQIFSGTGAVNFSNNIPDAYPQWWGAVNDLVFTGGIPPAAGGLIIASGTDSHDAVQSAIDSGATRVVITDKFLVQTTLDHHTPVDIVGNNEAYTQYDCGLFTNQDIPIITQTQAGVVGPGAVERIVLGGSGDSNLAVPTVVGIGIYLNAVNQRTYNKVYFYNLEAGIKCVGVINIFNQCDFGACVYGIWFDDTGANNRYTISNCNFNLMRYCVYNLGTGTITQNVTIRDCHADRVWRVIRGQFRNVIIDNNWFERVSDSVVTLPGCTVDTTIVEPVGSSIDWLGSGNQMVSSSSGNVGFGAGINIIISYFRNSESRTRVIDYGDSTQNNVYSPEARQATAYSLKSVAYDLATASGIQSITGVGFLPTSVEVMAAVGGDNRACWGMSDGSTQTCIYAPNSSAGPTTGFFSNGGTFLAMMTDSTNHVTGDIAFTSDGGTITWTKTGAPTGTLQMRLVFRR
jgi:hypothetical protein